MAMSKAKCLYQARSQ